MIVRPSSPSVALLLGAVLLSTACAEPGVVGPAGAWNLAASLEVGDAPADAAPDSGALTIYPYEGPGWREEQESTGLRMLSAAAPVPTIRIGVVQSTTSLKLGSNAQYTVADKANGLVLMTGVGGEVTISIAPPPPPFIRLQVVCANTQTVAARKAAAEAAGYVTFTEFVPPPANCTRLYLGQFAPAPANTSAARTAFRNEAIAKGFAGSDSFYRTVAVLAPSVFKLTRGEQVIESVNALVVTSSDGIVLINASLYRGRGEARLNGSRFLAGVNELPLEEYLYGVVPRELGPVAFPEFEAQKAQAVAARTFAIAGLGRRNFDGYDLRATTDDQVYGGYAAEHPISSAAVDATSGIVATHDGKLISANYHSTSGGHTADNEEAFNAAAVLYLRGVPDAQRGRALEHVPSLEAFRAHAHPTSLRAMKEGDYDSNWGRLHRWTFEWDMAEITRVISDFAQRPVGKVLAINVVERGPSGRVRRIQYVTEAGTFEHARDSIRSSLRSIGTNSQPSNLPSTLFFIEPIVDHASKELTGYRVYGGGFGHGVGLSQTGAVGMAEKGRSYDEILRHYYRDIELPCWYPSAPGTGSPCDQRSSVVE